MITERSLLSGILSAIGALARELTGKTLVVRLCDDEGRPCEFYFDGVNARLVPSDSAVALVSAMITPSAHPELRRPTPDDSPDQGHATEKEAQLFAVPLEGSAPISSAVNP